MRLESDGATATQTLPYGPSGRPSLVSGSPFGGFGPSSSQVSPLSRDTYSPLPGPPEVISHGLRRVCHKPAKTIRGLFGSRQTVLAPVSAFLDRTCFHVLPPSVVR